MQVGEPRIPSSFVLEAAAHFQATHQPLLKCRHASYKYTILAAGEDGEFQLYLEGWQPPFHTFREFAAYIDRPIEELADEGISVDEWDAQLDTFDIIQLLEEIGHHLETETGKAYALLKALPLPVTFTLPGLDADLGKLIFIEGLRPGDNTTLVIATSPLAVSCLQYCLDELDAGIQVKVVDWDAWD